MLLVPKCVYCHRRCWPWQLWGGRRDWIAGQTRMVVWHLACVPKRMQAHPVPPTGKS